ncbi:MAG TPA: class I SAM-dependent methyltransferase [Prosthecobacter sp.]|nr:class I SAM-dependent methyltransferase [Prosthecobacter sp.]HRK13733.1 class I SAM-dependent methyltransferase [Prosthecobacter sp.]
MKALEALFHTLDTQPEIPLDGSILFLHALAHPALEAWRGRLTCEQVWKPAALQLQQSGIPSTRTATGTFDTVLLLPERQRDTVLADFAKAHDLLNEGGTLVVALHNDWGAKRMEQQLANVAGELQTVSKSHCRVFWAKKHPGWKTVQLAQWRQNAAMRRILDGRFWSMPGLFHWDAIDEGSALLVEHLPRDLRGAVADLGAGWGFLSQHILQHCPDIRSLDMYEADARALECARRNTGLIPVPVRPKLHWHDVTQGLGGAMYDTVVMNPPFHDGRDSNSLLGLKFITSAAQALRPGGELWLVANRHLPYENLMAEAFETHRTTGENKAFKVLHGKNPARVTRMSHARPHRGRKGGP